MVLCIHDDGVTGGDAVMHTGGGGEYSWGYSRNSALLFLSLVWCSVQLLFILETCNSLYVIFELSLTL